MSAFVISLDFELYWGIHGVRSLESYAGNLRGVRPAVRGMLELFDAYGVRATWATVGFLFYDDPEMLRAERPETLPRYANTALSPYAYIDTPGRVMARDLHVAPEVIAEIVADPNQELGTHTFSHFLCLEPPTDLSAFRSDLAAALAVAERRFQRRPTSLIFPKNQYTDSHLAIAAELGITAFRGNPDPRVYQAAATGTRALGAGVGRVIDSYLPILGDLSSSPTMTNGIVNIPSSRFLRPWSPRTKWVEPLRIARVIRALRTAAARDRIYHLWWHPHNFGLYPRENLAALRQILDGFDRARRESGMQSRSMSAIAGDLLGAERTTP